MRYCGMCGSPLAQQQAGRERRRVSVVFVDLVGFSTMSRELDPEEVRDLADEVLTAVAGVIEDFDGYVDSLHGDGLIALFGAPHSHPDDPERAVLAASAALSAIAKVGRIRGVTLLGRAGVNTGIVIAGAVGSGKVRSYTVMGSVVNLAARLEEAASPGEVWVGPETQEATRHRLLFESSGPLELRGFPAVKEAFRLIPGGIQREVDAYADLPFVGRKPELNRLESYLSGVVASGSPREVWLAGEAGRGKTRLLREFYERIGPRYARLLIDHRPADAFDWVPVAAQLFGFSDNDDVDTRREKAERFLARVLPDEPRWHRIILVSIDLMPSQAWTRLERRTIDRTLIAWRDLIVSLTRLSDGPVAVVLGVESEPRDPDLRTFLELLQSTDAPILVVRTSRERTLPDGVEALHLPPLTPAESMQLLEGVASPTLRVAAEALVRQVGGVPAYLLELGRALSITQEDSFSGSLASLLQARLDMVDLRPRRLLARSALVGEASWGGLLAELAGTPDEIRTLVTENLLVPQGASIISGETEYRFQSELLRNAVLRMIPFAERPNLHLRIATWLEKNAPLAFAELTAEHFERGGSPDAAYAHFLAAADQTMIHNEVRRSFDLYERALALPLTAQMLAEAALAYAQAALAASQPTRAQEVLTRTALLLEGAPEAARAELERVRSELAREARALALIEAETLEAQTLEDEAEIEVPQIEV